MSALHDAATGLLRLLPAETAHRAGLLALKLGLGPRQGEPDDPVLKTRLGPFDLSNPVGLAAGFDKNAEAPDALLAAGFGFVEMGAVTPRPQPGNPRPRVFRLADDHAVINRMGFNNAGLEAAVHRLAARRHKPGLVGVNLGANKDSEDRAQDFVTGLRALSGLAGFLTVNISSPNTPGLRDLQSADALDDLLGRVAEARTDLHQPAPVFVKVAPDIADEDIPGIVRLLAKHGLDGLIVSNTTLARPDSLKSPHAGEAGGLSGRPLFERSTALLRLFRAEAGPDLPIIGVGGVEDGETAYAKIRDGANAIQLYSALVYGGPGLVRRIKSDLAARLKADGFASVIEAVGR